MELVELAAAYHAAKIAETAAITYRRDIGRKLQLAINHFDESQKTYPVGRYKVAISQPLNYVMDWEKWDAIRPQIDELYWPVDLKPVLDVRGVKYLQTEKPDVYRIISLALTIKPAAVQIAVTEKE